MFPGNNIVIEQLSRTINRYSTIEIFNQQFGSKSAYRSKRSTRILAAWLGLDSKIDVTHNTMSFGMIEFYFFHLLKVGEEFIIFYFACVTWHQTVDNTNFNLNPLCVASMKDKLPLGHLNFYQFSAFRQNVLLQLKKMSFRIKGTFYHLYLVTLFCSWFLGYISANCL
jgi:hypothetical protein